MRALVVGPGAWRALARGGSGSLEIALGAGGYVRLGDDGWVLLAPARAVMGPLTLAVSGLGRVRLEPGWPARVDGEVLEVGPHRISIPPQPQPRASAPGVVEVDPPGAPQPQPRQGNAGVVELSHVGREEPRPRRVDSRVVELLHVLAGAPPLELAAGVAALAGGHLDRAVAILAGRGDGLTPAGDDVLAGYAGFMALSGRRVALSPLAADRSPPISLAYLRCAERGELPEPAVRLLRALARRDDDAAARDARVLTSTWGASSGRALIHGFAAAAAAAAAQFRSNGPASASSSASLAPSPICV